MALLSCSNSTARRQNISCRVIGTGKSTNYWSIGNFLFLEPFKNREYQRYWIRVLGLPLYLWSTSVIKEIEDKCRGWLAREKRRTELKKHLRWAHIRLRGTREQIPNLAKIVDGEWVFLLPVWVEWPARYRRKGWVGATVKVPVPHKERTREPVH